MASVYDPHFDSSDIYSKAEFIFRLECLLSSYNGGHNAQMMTKNIEWAKGLPIGTAIGFEHEENGALVPVTIESVYAPILKSDVLLEIDSRYKYKN